MTTPMRASRAIGVVLAASSLGLAACSTPARSAAPRRSTTTSATSSTLSHSSATSAQAVGGPPLSAQEQAEANEANFKTGDFPSGWTASGLGSLVEPVIAALGACPALKDDLATGWAISPAFEAPPLATTTSSAQSSPSALEIRLALSAVAFGASKQRASAFVTDLQTSAGKACVRSAVTTGLAKVPGLSVHDLVVGAKSSSVEGHRTTELSLRLTEQVGKVALPTRIVLDVLSSGNVVATATFVNLSGHSSLEARLADDLARRA
jgi:hypothetical protein